MPWNPDQAGYGDQPNKPGWALQRLIMVHDGMRDDLTLLRRAVYAATRPDQDVAAAVAALGEVSLGDPLWSLRRYCAHFCSFVHDHHSVEDSMLFPVLLANRRNREAGLEKVIEELQADHRVLARYLDDVERALTNAPNDDAAKAEAIEALERLSEHLESHLAVEEARLAPALNALSAVVTEDDLLPPPEEGAIMSVNGTAKPGSDGKRET
ncbi:MAG TPA: hemerythrin domain-containing protein [Streptosporangiaceae bacterium]|jgi:iron-sulfur cluster repair protein YtfE (RIC family)|nr:hemerythrin domain-containing protein [Streptosporangiaceae bacterium]